MTFEEAKKLLKKEFMVIGIHKATEPFEFDESGWFEHEKPAVLEAFRVLAKEGYYISISGHDYNEREKRLKKEYEENTKSPGPGEEQPKEKKGIIYPTTFPKADFYHKHVLNEGNPALKEAASQFNDALLDEQSKKIAELTKDKELMKKATLSQLDDFIEIYNLLTKESQKTKRLGKEIARLNSIIHEKNEELKRKTKGCCELVTENVDLEKKLSDKDAVLSDVAEEGGYHSAIIVQCYKDITTISKDEAEIIERCTKNGTELHYSEKDGFTYTNMYGEEMPIRCLRGIFHVFTDEEIKNMKK